MTTSVKGSWRLLLVIVVFLAIFIYIATETIHRHLDLQNEQNVTCSSAGASRSSGDQSRPLGDDVTKVQSVGNFTDRLTTFNAFLSAFRAEDLNIGGNRTWEIPATNKLDVVWGARDDYLELLSSHSYVTTIVLPWLTNTPGSPHAWSSLVDTSNLLIQTYYEWTADDRLCSWIETPGKLRAKYDVIYNRKCSRNINDTVKPMSLRPLFLNGKPINSYEYWPNGGNSFPAHFYVDTPPFVFLMHIHRDAIVTELGDVITDGLALFLQACRQDFCVSLPSHLDDIVVYNEVFVITQFWGTGTFHRMVEIVPRLAMFVDFLRDKPHIRIAAPEVGGRLAELLGIIGLDASRLVTGVARAKIVYQPRSTRCGTANVQETQTLSRLYRDYIKRNFPPRPRNRLTLIRRSFSRRFVEQEAIEAALKRAAADFNLTYTLFADNPTPSLYETMTMFHSAVIVVGPHGAGLSNLLFSEPGTYVVEGVCNRPHVNLCYLRLAHVLGHHWHGVTSRGGCETVVDVPHGHVDAAVREYLRLWSSARRD